MHYAFHLFRRLPEVYHSLSVWLLTLKEFVNFRHCIIEFLELWSILVLFVSKIVDKFIKFSKLKQSCILQLLGSFIIFQHKDDLFDDFHVCRQHSVQ